MGPTLGASSPNLPEEGIREVKSGIEKKDKKLSISSACCIAEALEEMALFSTISCPSVEVLPGFLIDLATL